MIEGRYLPRLHIYNPNFGYSLNVEFTMHRATRLRQPLSYRHLTFSVRKLPL